MAVPAEKMQYVLFRLGSEEYGLPISVVSSIIRYEPATHVPHAAVDVDGVINLRGNVIPVVNLSRTFAGKAFEPTPLSRIVVTESRAGMIGLAVDSASEVAKFGQEAVRPAPETAVSGDGGEAFEGVVEHEGRLVILLRLDKVLPTGDLGSLGVQEAGEDV